MKTLQEQFQESSVFSNFPMKTLLLLEKLAIQKKYHKDEQIAGQGDKWPYLLMVHSGTILGIKDSPEGRLLVAATFYPGDVFWGLSFFDEQHQMPATLVAQENLVLYL